MNERHAPLTEAEQRDLARIEEELRHDPALAAAFGTPVSTARRAASRSVAWLVVLVVGYVVLAGALFAGAVVVAAGGYVLMVVAISELVVGRDRRTIAGGLRRLLGLGSVSRRPSG